VTTTLSHPVVGVQSDTRIAVTIPTRAVVEVSETSPRGWFDVTWNGATFSVFREDLLNACPVGDVGVLMDRRFEGI
jgi:hypothetical protein